MDNNDVAAVLDEIAELLDIEGESSFRVGAYHRAAHVIRALPQDVGEIDRAGNLTGIAGVGQGIADRLHELLTTGRMTYFEELKGRVPESLAQLIHVPGLGPKKAKLVYDRLHIETMADLKQAVAKKQLRKLPGMGAKTEEKITRGITQYERQTQRLLLSQAVPAAEKMVDYLAPAKEVAAVSPAGSLRRRAETIGDIDILCATDRPDRVADRFCGHPDIAVVQLKGPTKCSILLKSGLQVDLRLVRPEEYGAAIQYFTGSKAHNIKVREIAKKKGLKLSEYGVTDIAAGKMLAGASEADVYRLLGLEWIEPELRENRGEIEAAAAGKLPKLIEQRHIKGDLHTHTKASDGAASLTEMAEFAISLGYSYLVVSDHALNLRIAGGLNMEEFNKLWKEIDRLNRRWRAFKLLKGVELNIDNEGNVDFDDEFLAGFDVVIASIHSGFRQEKERLTARMLTAIANPHIDIIAHPTGRLLGRRPPYQLDLNAVFKAAAKHKTALELNAFPDRLDLRDDYLIEAKRAGCKFAVNTDAHHSGQLNYIKYGISMARRGWLEPGDVINTYTLEKLQKVLAFTK